MNTEQLKLTVPSLFAEQPSPKVSDRYTFIPTTDYLEALGSRGWTLDSAKQARVRKSAPEHARHLITLSHVDRPNTKPELGTIRPRISLLNSHNGTSRFEIILGMLRVVCENGLMVTVGDFEQISFMHNSKAKDVADVLTDTFFTAADRMVDAAVLWAEIQLSDDQVSQLATQARNIRFGEDSPVDALSLLRANREADQGNNLWNTFNRLQENTIIGGTRWPGMRRRSRRISNINAELTVNRDLWAAAAKFAN